MEWYKNIKENRINVKNMSNQFIDKLFICVCVLFVGLKMHCVYTMLTTWMLLYEI